jgi:hypothetical protein
LNNKSKDENVDDVETEEGEKRETSRIQTAPAELGNPKETADEWGRLFHLLLLPQFESKRIYVSIHSRG